MAARSFCFIAAFLWAGIFGSVSARSTALNRIDSLIPSINGIIEKAIEKGLLTELGMIESDPNLSKIDPLCTTCARVFDDIITGVQNGSDISVYMDQAIEICITLGIGSELFCNDFLDMVEPELEFVFLNTTGLTGTDFCGTFLVGEGCLSDNPERNYTIALNESKPDPYAPPLEYGNKTLKVLHLSDTHYDPYYMPYSNSKCPELYCCCRNDSGPVVNPEDAAGFWGDYRECDAPKWLLELMYAHIAETHQIDFIIWTGDVVAHNIWSTSDEEIITTIRDTAELVSKYFPNIPAYPSLGNHEGQPVNSFPQPYIGEPFNISWLYPQVNEVWSRWLDASTSETLLYGGYYSQTIQPGLRLLSVNSNFCYGFNWWLVADSHDVAQTLEYMANELQEAENVGDSVYIIMHIPAGSGDCHLTWAHQFNRIVHRYENTITGIFYGHTHKDSYALFFDMEDMERVYEVAYIGQSQTPYSELNPGYKIYTIEGDFPGSKYRVLDHENWIMDLDLANSLNVTTFFKLYSAKEEYSLPDLSPQSWYNLVYIMDQPDNVMFDHFYRNYVKDSRPQMEDGCDSGCKYDKLCDILTSDNSNREKCDILSTPA